jgi:hypothetical protein
MPSDQRSHTDDGIFPGVFAAIPRDAFANRQCLFHHVRLVIPVGVIIAAAEINMAVRAKGERAAEILVPVLPEPTIIDAALGLIAVNMRSMPIS